MILKIKTMKKYYLSLLRLVLIVAAVTLVCYNSFAERVEQKVEPFHKVMTGPGFDVKLEYGDEEKVILDADDPRINDAVVEVVGGKLKIYMPGGKINIYDTDYDGFKGKVIIMYKTLDYIEIRSEGKVFCKTPIHADKLKIKLFGETKAYFANVRAEDLITKIYGYSELHFKSGYVNVHKIKSYGESQVYAAGLETDNSKVTAFGESKIKLHSRDVLKITTFGESQVVYAGSPQIKNFIELGTHTVSRATVSD